MLYEPIKPGPITGVGDELIITRRFPTNTSNDQIIDFVFELDGLVYSDFFILSIVTLILLVAFQLVKHNKKNVTSALNMLYEQAVEMFEVLVNQENMDLRNRCAATKCLWLFYCMTGFFLVIGILLNLLSADLVVSHKPSQIEGLKDQLSDDFKHIQPMTVSNFFLLGVLKQSNPESDLGKLYKLMLRKEKDSLIFLDPSQGKEGVMKLVKLAQAAYLKRDRSMVFPKSYWTNYLRPLGCQVQPEMTIDIHESQGTLFNGLLTTMFSKKVDLELFKYLEYRIRTSNEMGLEEINVQKAFLHSIKENNQEISFESFRCIFRMDKEVVRPPRSLGLADFVTLFDGFFLILMVAVVVIAFEFALNLSVKFVFTRIQWKKSWAIKVNQGLFSKKSVPVSSKTG